MRITDLLNDYHDDSVPLPEVQEPTAERTRELTLAKLQPARKKRRRLPVGVLVAACMALALSITAGAVGYTMWDAARSDAGLTGQDIPEYTEYQPEEAAAIQSSLDYTDEGPVQPMDGAKIELVSTLCSGSDVTAYLAISPVTQEMADASWPDAETLDTFAVWEPGEVAEAQGITSFEGFSCGGTQVEYDPETETALVCMEFHGDVFQETEAFTVGVLWHHEENYVADVKYYGTVTIPITPSEDVIFAPEAALENQFLTDETATLTEVSVGAGYVEFRYEVKPFEQLCQEYGEDAWFTIGDTYWGYYDELDGRVRESEYTELDAQVAYERSWEVSLGTMLEGACLTLTDGTELSISPSDLQLVESGMIDAESTETYQRFALPQAIDISQVASLTLGGTTYTIP